MMTFFILSFIATIISIPLCLLSFVHYLFGQLSKRNLDIYQYKITNFPLTVFGVFFYLFVVGILFNFLCLYACYNSYMNNIQLDIRPFFIHIFLFLLNIYNLNIILSLYLVIIALLSLLCLLLLCISIHKDFLHLLFSLHIVMFASYTYDIDDSPEDLYAVRKNAKFSKFYEIYTNIIAGFFSVYYGLLNLITQTINKNIPKIPIRDLDRYWYGLPARSEETKFLSFIISRIVTFMWRVRRGEYYLVEYVFFLFPFIALFYDCIFNNFVINHAFYCFTLYIMFVQLFRITNSVYFKVIPMLGILYDLYYGPEKYIYFFPVYLKPYFDTYIWNKCSDTYSARVELDALCDIEVGDFGWMYVNSFRFEYIPDSKIYENIMGIALRETSENVFISENEGYEWTYVGGVLPKTKNKNN